MFQLFRVFIPTSIVGLLLSEIVLVAGCYLAAMYWQVEEFGLYFWYENGALRVALVAATLLLGLYLNDCYERVRMKSRSVFVQQLCLVIGSAFLIQAILSYGNLPLRMPRQSMLIGSVLCLLLIPPWRTAYAHVTLRMLGAERVLLVGTHPLMRKIAETLVDRPEYAMQPVGFVAETDAVELGADCPVPALGTLDRLEESVRVARPDRIVLGLREQTDPKAILKALNLVQSGYRVEGMAEMYEAVFGRVALSQLGPPQLLSGGLPDHPVNLAIQTVYSFVFAVVGLIVASPVMVLAAIAVRLSSPGPIFYRQTRAGKNNRPFTLYKFRSMYVDAEARTGAVWAQQNDPRITAVGNIIRKYRVDELPQLLNVLRGDMSIVGPRPERPEFVQTLAEQIPYYMQRLRVKPGITGWAQINYRYGNTIEDTVIKLEYDLYYIKNLAPQLDFYIMFHTMKTILLTRGAY